MVINLSYCAGQMYMVMERSTGGNLESYLRKQLRNKLSIIKQSKRFAPEVDDLLKTLTQFCFDIASAMEFLEAKKVYLNVNECSTKAQCFINVL